VKTEEKKNIKIKTNEYSKHRYAYIWIICVPCYV